MRPRRWLTLSGLYSYVEPLEVVEAALEDVAVCDARTQPICDLVIANVETFEESFVTHSARLSADLDLRRGGPWRILRGWRLGVDAHLRSPTGTRILAELLNARAAYEVTEGLEIAVEGWNLLGEQTVSVTNDPRIVTLRVRGRW